MLAPSLLRIERMNFALGGVMVIVAGITQPTSIALGVSVGVVLTCLNFALLRRIIVRATADAANGGSTNRMLLVMPKMMLLMAAVVLALKFLPISAPGFAIGYSVFVASIMIEAVYSVIAPAQTRDFPDEPSTTPPSDSAPPPVTN
ncbi:MAG TPA: ATP synthase subunit I [Kofleriaceae bacterium]|nr:ATP synthase subunit I [Kofleriaceae bacterium]